MPDSLFGPDSDEDPLDTSEDVFIRVNEQPHISVEHSADSPSQPQHIDSKPEQVSQLVATPEPPPIPGFYLFPDAIPPALQHSLSLSLSESIWPGPSSNQVMLFDSPTHSSLPDFLSPLLGLLPDILSPLPSTIRDIIFDQTKPRQCILNLYYPGQGISSHVDLPSRYEDGIVGISLLSSTVMKFTPLVDGKDSYALRLKPGSIYVLSGQARYDYKHGIPYREEDIVLDGDGVKTMIRRGVRMSITLRRMKDGAEIIGPCS